MLLLLLLSRGSFGGSFASDTAVFILMEHAELGVVHIYIYKRERERERERARERVLVLMEYAEYYIHILSCMYMI